MVGFADRLRAWLRGDEAPAGGERASGPAGNGATPRRRRSGPRGQHPAGGSFDSAPLLEFVRSRRGVEVYLEPRTNLYGDSVLLVADDGEYLRRPVPDAATVRRFCSEHGIPVYDAARTGYPRRVRDYDRGVRPDRVSLEDLPPWPGTTGAADGGEEEPPPPPPTV
jgi:hypothetical protein